MPSPSPSPSPPFPTTPTKPALVTATLETTVPVPVPVPIAVAMPVSKFPDRALVVVVGVVPLSGKRLLLILLLDLDTGLFQARLPLWMGAFLALGPIRAEAGEIVRAHLLADMFLGAPGPQRAEALIVMWTGRQLALRVDVQVQALVAVGTEAVAQEEVALGHLAQVELVQELAALTLFTQAAQPVLAHERVERVSAILLAAAVGNGDVALRAAGSERAVAVDVGLAYWAIGGEAVEVGSLEKRREGECRCIRGCCLGQQLLRQLACRRRRRSGRPRHGLGGLGGLWQYLVPAVCACVQAVVIDGWCCRCSPCGLGLLCVEGCFLGLGPSCTSRRPGRMRRL